MLPTGLIVDLIITKQVERKLPEPYNTCVESYLYSNNRYLNATLISSFLQANSSYRQINCLQLCSLTGYNKHDCDAECPSGCETTSYTTKVEVVKYNPSSYRFSKSVEVIRQYNDVTNMTDAEIKARLLNLYVFIDDLSHQEIYQIEKVTKSDLLSNIGGTLGLFMGISLISFVEVLELIWRLTHVK